MNGLHGTRIPFHFRKRVIHLYPLLLRLLLKVAGFSATLCLEINLGDVLKLNPSIAVSMPLRSLCISTTKQNNFGVYISTCIVAQERTKRQQLIVANENIGCILQMRLCKQAGIDLLVSKNVKSNSNCASLNLQKCKTRWHKKDTDASLNKLITTMMC